TVTRSDNPDSSCNYTYTCKSSLQGGTNRYSTVQGTGADDNNILNCACKTGTINSTYNKKYDTNTVTRSDNPDSSCNYTYICKPGLQGGTNRYSTVQGTGADDNNKLNCACSSYDKVNKNDSYDSNLRNESVSTDNDKCKKTYSYPCDSSKVKLAANGGAVFNKDADKCASCSGGKVLQGSGIRGAEYHCCPNYGTVYKIQYDVRGGRSLNNVILDAVNLGYLNRSLLTARMSKNDDYAYFPDNSDTSQCVRLRTGTTNQYQEINCEYASTPITYPSIRNVSSYLIDSNGNVIAKINNTTIASQKYQKIDGSSISITENTRDIQVGSNNNCTSNELCRITGTITIDGCTYDVSGIHRKYSPLVLDLKDNGFKFTSVDDGTDFDLDADGTADKTAWTAKQDDFDDAFLVLDKNGDGQVNSGAELFGDQNGSENGFLELAKYDENGDGKIDKNDSVYSQLRLWADMNGDGKVDHPQEWKTLEEMGVTEISTSYDKVLGEDGNARTDEYGNDTSLVGSFKRIVEEVVDGVKTIVEKIGNMIDVFFNMISGNN
ncbi:hypothetical protein IJS77_05485, partial [bacterium]|nr:hypothetical protein [bacterium]